MASRSRFRIIIVGKANQIAAQLALIRRMGLVPAVRHMPRKWDSRAPREQDADGFVLEGQS
jgi:hypothetical protein